MSILDSARAGQNALERLMNSIPGFKGYREKELRRDADKIQREHLAARLETCKKALNDVSAAATRGGSLDAINDVETARKRLDKVIARIRYADRGYAGFFDPIKVDEAKLERAYQFDLDLVVAVDALTTTAGEAARGADVKAALARLIADVDALDAGLAQREQVLSGIQ